jgi:hypothetical protein
VTAMSVGVGVGVIAAGNGGVVALRHGFEHSDSRGAAQGIRLKRRLWD